MAYHIGHNVRVGVAINAEVGGMTFGQTAGTADVMKVATGGGFKVEERNAKAVVEELDVDARDVVTGGKYYTITMELALSYSFREKLFQLIAGGAIASAGVDPTVHDYAKDDKLLFGEVFVEYSDQAAAANEFIKETYANFCANAFSIKESPEGNATMTVSGIATARTRITNQAALTAVNHSEIVSWSHLTVSLDGATTYKQGDISLDINSPLTEADFAHAATTPATLDYIGRAGFRETKWGVQIKVDSSAWSLVEDSSSAWTGANSYTWHNGGAAAAEREITITFGNSYMEGQPRVMGAWEREKMEISLIAMDGTTPSFDFQIKNSRAAIPA